jgi:NAD(P)-dependent dehydrogenase (short-subunit alcohol dehydrogenase family)
MKSVFITGANRGLGLEFCRQYLKQGWKVMASCRNPETAHDLIQLSEKFALDIYPLDLSDETALKRVAVNLQGKPLDLLINNAGVYGGSPQDLAHCYTNQWLDTFAVNTIAPAKLTHALLPNLRLSEGSKVAFLTSKMGSMSDNSSGGAYIYRSSKAALNAVIKSLSIDLAAENIAVAALHPGWVKTDMGGPNGLINAEQSVSGLRQVIDQLSVANTGCFVDYQNQPIAW